jgi:hypothetical protein
MIEVLAFLAGVAIGVVGYRYMLKRDPEALEHWASEIRRLRRR